MCVGDGEAFQQLLEGRIERHPLRETSVPKKRMVVGSREICERKKEERKRREREGKRELEKCQDRRKRGGMGHPRGAGRA